MGKYTLLTRPYVTFRKMRFKNDCSMCSTFYYLSFDQFVNNKYVKKERRKELSTKWMTTYINFSGKSF